MNGKPKAIVVLGMHRSGTSAVTRVLNLLGAEIPGELLEPLPGNNPTGFWESRQLLEIHDEYLAAIGSSWDDITPRRPPDEAVVESTVDRLVAFLAPALEGPDLHVIKDPRVCRLIPLWLAVLDPFDSR